MSCLASHGSSYLVDEFLFHHNALHRREKVVRKEKQMAEPRESQIGTRRDQRSDDHQVNAALDHAGLSIAKQALEITNAPSTGRRTRG